MFRDQWDEIESKVQSFAQELKDKLLNKMDGSQSFGEPQDDGRAKKASRPERSEGSRLFTSFRETTKEEREKLKSEYLKWGKDYVEKLKAKVDNEKFNEAKENFFVLIRNLGINDQLLRETFANNKKELLDPVVGEAIAILALVLGWSKKDKEAFSQALGEIGVAGLFAAKPFILLIAICGLAYGYNRSFHKEAFKKGGVLGIAGMTAAWIAPGAFIGLLAAIVTMVYLNKKLSVDKPIEKQLKEIFQQIKGGEFFDEVRQSWKNFESFLTQLVNKGPSTETS